MSDADFIQQRLFRRRYCKLTRDGITVTDKGLVRSHRYHVFFESIPPKPQAITSLPRKLMVVAIILTVVAFVCILAVVTSARSVAGSVALLLWAGLATVCWVGCFLSRTSVLIYAQDNAGLLLYSDRPSPEAVSQFVRRMFQFRNNYLRLKYGQFLPDEPLGDRLARLNLLRNQEVIDETEYNFLRRQQTSDSPPSKGPVGFSY